MLREQLRSCHKAELIRSLSRTCRTPALALCRRHAACVRGLLSRNRGQLFAVVGAGCGRDGLVGCFGLEAVHFNYTCRELAWRDKPHTAWWPSLIYPFALCRQHAWLAPLATLQHRELHGRVWFRTYCSPDAGSLRVFTVAGEHDQSTQVDYGAERSAIVHRPRHSLRELNMRQ